MLLDGINENEKIIIDKSLLLEALTPPSIGNAPHFKGKSYQVLEHIGDAVLKLILTEYIHEHPNLPNWFDEGYRTKLRSNAENNKNLAKHFFILKFGKENSKNLKDITQAYLEGYSKYNSTNSTNKKIPKYNVPKLNEKICADIYEAVIGAIFLTYKIESYDSAFYKIKLWIKPILDEIDENLTD